MKSSAHYFRGVTFAFLLHLSFNAHAFHDPKLGRFINRDPLGEQGFETIRHISPWAAEAKRSEPVVESHNEPNLYTFAGNNPINAIDPFGLSSIHAQVAAAIAKGDVAALKILLGSGALSPAQTAMVQAALSKYRSTAVQWIARNCKASIGREFPSQFYNQTLEQIRRAARSGNKLAKKAWKLINDKRFAK